MRKILKLIAFLAVLSTLATLSQTRSDAAKFMSVRSFGARGNGKTDDTAAFARAMAAAVRAGKPLYVPAGIYRLRRIQLPSGLKLRGANRRTTWLKGSLTFGSNDSISGLKLGDLACETKNRANATGTTFTDCRFRGVGAVLGFAG